MKSDEVKKLPKPEFVGVKDIFVLTSLKVVLVYMAAGTHNNEGLDIWIMERDGWKLLMKIYNLPTICIPFLCNMKLLWCSENGEIFFHGQSMNQLVIYHPKQKQFVTVSLPDMSRDFKSPLPSICLDSFYFSKVEGRI